MSVRRFKPPESALLSASRMPVPLDFTSSRSVPTPATPVAVTKYSAALAPAVTVPSVAVAAPSTEVSAKSARSTPVTASVNVTRHSSVLSIVTGPGCVRAIVATYGGVGPTVICTALGAESFGTGIAGTIGALSVALTVMS